MIIARSFLVIITLGVLPISAARADDAAVEPAWGVGLQLGMLGSPHGNLGLPLDDIAGIPFDGPIEIVVRRELDQRHMALNAGIGFPHDALGIAGWVGFETYLPVVENELCALELYVDPGIQLGFLGPDYYASHSDAFVGYNYGISGPLALAMRAPLGVRVRWPDLRLDTYVEAVSMLTVTPARESFFVTFAGIRFRI